MIDQETKVTLEGILTVDEIIAENIVQIEDIADEERTPSDFPAIYLLSSSRGEEFVLSEEGVQRGICAAHVFPRSDRHG